jgi:hypothetical protein
MTFIKVLERLEAYGSVSVRPELSPGEQKAVNEGLAALHVYQDQPSDTPYPFRAKTYVLKPTDRFYALADKWKRDGK